MDSDSYDEDDDQDIHPMRVKLVDKAIPKKSHLEDVLVVAIAPSENRPLLISLRAGDNGEFSTSNYGARSYVVIDLEESPGIHVNGGNGTVDSLVNVQKMILKDGHNELNLSEQADFGVHDQDGSYEEPGGDSIVDENVLARLHLKDRVWLTREGAL